MSKLDDMFVLRRAKCLRERMVCANRSNKIQIVTSSRGSKYFYKGIELPNIVKTKVEYGMDSVFFITMEFNENDIEFITQEE